jgi:hypothetical protein
MKKDIPKERKNASGVDFTKFFRQSKRRQFTASCEKFAVQFHQQSPLKLCCQIHQIYDLKFAKSVYSPPFAKKAKKAKKPLKNVDEIDPLSRISRGEGAALIILLALIPDFFPWLCFFSSHSKPGSFHGNLFHSVILNTLRVKTNILSPN